MVKLTSAEHVGNVKHQFSFFLSVWVLGRTDSLDEPKSEIKQASARMGVRFLFMGLCAFKMNHLVDSVVKAIICYLLLHVVG